MTSLTKLGTLLLHIDIYLDAFVLRYGFLSHFALFAIIFCETGLVFMPFLPGDSLLFAAGAVSANGPLNVWLLFVLLSSASFLGDNLNYWIGRFFGKWLLKRNSRFLKKSHIDRTHAFFEKYGPKVILFARFIPIVRTCSPFVAGLGEMQYRTFASYSFLGGLCWVGACLSAGYLFGNISFVKNNFGMVVIAIIFISFLPILVNVLKSKLNKN